MAKRDYLKTAKELEKERRKLLRNVMATIPDSLLILDRTLLIKTANRSFYKLFQVKPKEVIGRGITDMLGDEDGKLSAKLAALLGTKDRVENYELRYQSAKLDERIFNITARGIIVAEEEEEEEEELVVIRDITERKRAEEMLRRTEENFRRSLDDSPLGIRIVNSDGETTYANRAMLDIYGYAGIEELKATPVKERYTPESYAQHQMRKEKRQRGEYVPSNYEISIVRKGGEIQHLEVFRKEVLWNGHTQFQVIYQDITERKAAEEALKDSEERLKATVMNAPIGIATSGADRYFLSANDAFCGILGYTEAELQKMSFRDITYPEDIRESVARMDDIDAGKIASFSQEKRYIKKDGKVIIGKVMVSAVRDHEGRPYLYIAELEDITERKRTEEKTTYLASFPELNPSPILELDLEGNLGYLNPAAKGIFPDLDSLGIKHPFLADWKGVIKDLQSGNRGKVVNREVSVGGSFYDQVIFSVAGNQIRLYARNITERKQAEEALKKSEGRLKEAQALGRIGSWEFDIERQTITWSDETYVLYERNPELGPPSPEEEARYYSPEQAKILRDYTTRAIETGQAFSYDLEVMLPSGKKAYYHAIMQPVKDAHGRVVKLSGTVQDITERKQAEEEIRRLLERESHAAREWQETFDAVTDIVMLISPHHELLRINKTGCESMGKKLEELIGKKCYEVVHGLSAPIEQCPCVAALKAKKIRTSELTDQGRHYLLTAYPIFGEGREVVAFAHIIKDITEYKQAEEKRLELERKAQNASRLASIGEMAAGIAHEINNPLTPILGFTEMLMKRELPEDAKSDLKIVYDSARRTADVTRRLLTFARQSKPMRVLCDINEVIESTIQLRAYHLKTNNIKVVSELAPELPQTMADAGQLQQVVLNLIINAEYEMTQSHGGGNLLIKTEKTGNITRVSIKDDGPGISRENMERLFTPFFTTKKVGEGTGLGLSVCHGIIAEHNGRIYAESEVGKGATFIVEIPIVKQQKEKGVKPSEPDKGEAVVEAAKARILVVDDEPTIVQVLKRALTDEGYEVRGTGKAKEALRLVESGKFACILLDIRLPDMSGIELYQHLDNTDKSYAQRIIFITGDVMGPDTMEFFSRVRASYITKPFDIEQLKREVKNKLTLGA